MFEHMLTHVVVVLAVGNTITILGKGVTTHGSLQDIVVEQEYLRRGMQDKEFMTTMEG